MQHLQVGTNECVMTNFVLNESYTFSKAILRQGFRKPTQPAETHYLLRSMYNLAAFELLQVEYKLKVGLFEVTHQRHRPHTDCGV
jgi:hypothetical protein